MKRKRSRRQMNKEGRIMLKSCLKYTKLNLLRLRSRFKPDVWEKITGSSFMNAIKFLRNINDNDTGSWDRKGLGGGVHINICIKDRSSLRPVVKSFCLT
jgi:hypothetical protein